MSALTVNTDRRVENGVTRFGPLIASEVAFQGSLLGLDTTTGFVKRMAPGLLFFGIAEKGLLAKDASAVNGGYQIQARTGIFTFVAVIAGLTPGDLPADRRVFATSDNHATPHYRHHLGPI